jgi:Cdc6-like AAA superfamily ATPase
MENREVVINIPRLHNVLRHYDAKQLPIDPLVYPYHEARLVSRLRPSNYKTPGHFLSKEDKDFHKTIIDYEATSDSTPYSPSSPSDELHSYFVITPTYNDLDDHLQLDDNGNWCYRNIVYTGPKGSGKTSMQNFWLNENHRAMAERNIFYIRCNAQELYDSWRKIKPDTANDLFPTIFDYFDFQLLSVLSCHKTHSGISKKLMTIIRDSGRMFRHKQSRAEDGSEYSRKPIYDYIDGHICARLESDSEYITSHIFPDKVTKRREYFRWRECSKAARRLLEEKGVKFLLILDGVDNLHLNTEPAINLYQQLLPGLTDFILRKGPHNELRLAVMRKRTWLDILRQDHSTTGCIRVAVPVKIEHVIPNVGDIVTKRTEWIAQKRTNGEPAQDSIIKTIDVIKAAAAALPSTEVMHDNLRNIIVNSATLAQQVGFRWHQLRKDPSVDLNKQALKLMRRNLFLNGTFILETNDTFLEKNRVKGLPYFNPFWTECIKCSQRQNSSSLLFLRIRLLEILLNQNLNNAQLVHFLKDGFGYEKCCVEQVINDSRAFGWIDSISYNEDSQDVTYEISATGNFLLDQLLCDLDVLYMLAIDTLIPKCFIEQNLFLVHTNHLTRSEYAGSAAVTVLSFLRYLQMRLTQDQNHIDSECLGNSYRQIFLNEQYVEKLANSIAQSLKETHESDLDTFKREYGSLLQYL